MSWTVKDVEEKVKGLTPKQKKVWVTVANGALDRCLKAGRNQEDCEGSAIRQANTVAKRIHENDESVSIYWDEEEGWIINYTNDIMYELSEVEVFAVGKWNKDAYTKKDLDDMVKAFDTFKGNWTPVLKRGHQTKQEQPALGYITELKRQGKKLIATITNVPKLVYTAIKKGLFKRVSAEIYWNYEDGETGKRYPRVLKAIALLGSSIPAVGSLKEIEAFFEDQAIEIKSYDVEIEDEPKIYEMEIKEHQNRSGKNNPNWKDGRSPDFYRHYLEGKKVCERCGKAKPKRIHHIDGNTKNSKNSNLLAVCDSCHMKLHNGNWKKNKSVEYIMKIDDGVKYPKEAYLYVPDLEKPSTWKLRVWESPEKKITRKQLGRAAAAFSPGGFRGQKVELPTEVRTKVKAKLRSLYKGLGIEKDDMPKHIFKEENNSKGENDMDFEKLLAEREAELEELKTKLADYEAIEKTAEITEYKEKLEAKETEIEDLKKYEIEVKELKTKNDKLAEENKAYTIQLNDMAKGAKESDVKGFVEKHGARGTKQILPKHEELVTTILMDCPVTKDYSVEGSEDKISLADMVRQFVSELPVAVDVSEKGKTNNKEITDNAKAEVAEAINEYMEKNADVDYATAMRTVLDGDSELKERYFQATTVGMNK